MLGIDSSVIGLSVIIIAWIVQASFSWNGNKRLSNIFLIIYALGTALLIADAYAYKSGSIVIFNAIIIFLVCIVLIRYNEKKPKIKPALKAKGKKKK